MTRIYWILSDTWVMTRRGLLKYVRVPQLLIFSTIQPVMFMLLFVYVFGGAIAGSTGNYLNFLVPGVMVQTIIFSSQMTGVGLAQDLRLGITDRFHSLPMSRAALLAGRIISDTIRNLFVLLLMILVGFILGFRFQDGIPNAIGAIALILAGGMSFAWISAMIGLNAKDPEAVQMAGMIWIFPLVFASSIFVPVDTMPEFLQAFAKHSPITLIANSVRALTLGGDVTSSLYPALAWIAGITAVFSTVSVKLYQRNT